MLHWRLLMEALVLAFVMSPPVPFAGTTTSGVGR